MSHRPPMTLPLACALLFLLVPTAEAASNVPAENNTDLLVSCTGKTGTAGTFRLTLDSGGRTRTYKLTVPSSYQASTGMPLVINLHGWGGTGEQHDTDTGMSAKAQSAGFIVAHPDGVDNSWNAGACCGGAVSQGVDDVGFIRALVKSISSSYCVDPDRVFATGFSNGGYMSHRLGCEAADVFAAIAPHAGLIGIDTCAPPRAVPVVQSQGTADLLVPYRNAKASNDYWVQYNKCTSTSVIYKNGPATCSLYTGCTGNAEVKWCEVRGMNHVWPTGAYLPITDVFWDFFVAHPMMR
ncbi:MAG: alpha/beta hydrolase family esterase [Myxococcota bacterium]